MDGNAKTYRRLVTIWAKAPPTPANVRAMLAQAHQGQTGQIIAAAHVAHAMADDNNKYSVVDLWGPRQGQKMSVWFKTISERTGDWHIWWWRQLYWPVWDNARQWLGHYSSGCWIWARLNREIDPDIKALYRRNQWWALHSIPVRVPASPQEIFGYAWRNVPAWEQTSIVNVTLAKPQGETREHYKRGIKGDYWRIALAEGACIVSNRSLKALLHNKATHTLHVDEERNWIASVSPAGIALVATRMQH